MWSTCPSAAITPNGTVVLWTMSRSGAENKAKLGKDAWGKACKDGASPCGFAKHGCGPNVPPPLHPPPPPSLPVSSSTQGAGETEVAAQWGRRPGRYNPREHADATHDGELSLLISDGPAGPWRPHSIPMPVSGASLAAPWILPNVFETYRIPKEHFRFDFSDRHERKRTL